jgi:alkylhydroperoxidase family enzyme
VGSWLGRVADRNTPFEQALGLRPELLEQFRDLYSQLWSDRLVDHVVLELCRLRIAQLHGSDAELSIRYAPAAEAGLTEEKVGALPSWPSSALFSDHERACLAYAEKLVIDVHAITDAESEAVAAAMAPSELVTFTLALGLFDALGRFRLVLGLERPFAVVTVVPAPTDGVRTLY